MKTTVLTISLFLLSLFSSAQDSLALDSIRMRVQLFNDSITHLLEYYDKEGIDFIAARSTVNYGPNCRFTVREDSCSRMFILHLGEEYLTSYIHVARIQSRNPNDKRFRCDKELDGAYYALTHYEDYFTKDKPDYSQYEPEKIIFFGSINGRYMNETVDKDYFSSHHPGMFYDYFNASY